MQTKIHTTIMSTILDTLPCKACGSYPDISYHTNDSAKLSCINPKCILQPYTQKHRQIKSLINQWNNNN